MKTLLDEIPVLHPQECSGNYLFSGVTTVATSAFMEVFGEEATSLCFASQYMILENENPDYLQTFTYKGIDYWCMASFQKGDKASDYEELDNLYITFMLPSDY